MDLPGLEKRRDHRGERRLKHQLPEPRDVPPVPVIEHVARRRALGRLIPEETTGMRDALLDAFPAAGQPLPADGAAQADHPLALETLPGGGVDVRKLVCGLQGSAPRAGRTARNVRI
jgi:hypothetical protein